jgi:hypothetical protein
MDEGVFKQLTSTVRVYTDGGIAHWDYLNEEWDDAPLKNGLLKYSCPKRKAYVAEPVENIVAECFIPNPNNYKFVKIIQPDIKNKYAVENLEWVSEKPNKSGKGVGYTYKNNKFQVTLYDKEAKKTKYYGRYDTAKEAQARVAELRNNMKKN